MDEQKIFDIIIIGSGPAGYTAAIYAGRANLKTLVIAGTMHGGQLMLTTDVENYPGFPHGILGPDLMDKFRKQAQRFGAEILDQDATRVDFKTRPFRIYVGDDEYKAQAVIISSGASAKWLGLESEARLRGRGVSSCATCDGAFFKDKEIVVIGGGDTAMEEAIFLTKFATKVTVIHRRDKLRASKILQERAFKNPKIQFVWNSVVDEILGKEKAIGVLVRNVNTDEKTKIPCEGVFVAIGHTPNTEIFRGQVELDEKGYILVKDDTRTNVDGVFVAGDVRDFKYRQAVTAAGDGCRAAMDAEKFLEAQH